MKKNMTTITADIKNIRQFEEDKNADMDTFLKAHSLNGIPELENCRERLLTRLFDQSEELFKWMAKSGPYIRITAYPVKERLFDTLENGHLITNAGYKLRLSQENKNRWKEFLQSCSKMQIYFSFEEQKTLIEDLKSVDQKAQKKYVPQTTDDAYLLFAKYARHFIEETITTGIQRELSQRLNSLERMINVCGPFSLKKTPSVGSKPWLLMMATLQEMTLSELDIKAEILVSILRKIRSDIEDEQKTSVNTPRAARTQSEMDQASFSRHFISMLDQAIADAQQAPDLHVLPQMVQTIKQPVNNPNLEYDSRDSIWRISQTDAKHLSDDQKKQAIRVCVRSCKERIKKLKDTKGKIAEEFAKETEKEFMEWLTQYIYSVESLLEFEPDLGQLAADQISCVAGQLESGRTFLLPEKLPENELLKIRTQYILALNAVSLVFDRPERIRMANEIRKQSQDMANRVSILRRQRKEHTPQKLETKE